MNSETTEPKLRTVFDSEAFGKSFSTIVAIMPALLLVFLSLVNPGYMAYFLLTNVRPLALAILGLAAFLSALSFVLMRRCASMVRGGRRVLGLILATFVMMFVVFPATLLVILGPAALALVAAEF